MCWEVKPWRTKGRGALEENRRPLPYLDRSRRQRCEAKNDVLRDMEESGSQEAGSKPDIGNLSKQDSKQRM
jgi:hypothetical protein